MSSESTAVEFGSKFVDAFKVVSCIPVRDTVDGIAIHNNKAVEMGALVAHPTKDANKDDAQSDLQDPEGARNGPQNDDNAAFRVDEYVVPRILRHIRTDNRTE